MILKNKLFKSGIYTIILKGTGILLSYAFTLFITNLYGAKIYGQYSLFFAFVSILSIIALFGVDRSIIKLYNAKEISEGKQNVSQSIVLVLMTSIGLSLVLWLVWEWIIGLFFTDSEVFLNLRPYVILVLFYSIYLFISESIRAKNKLGLFSFLRFNMVYLLGIIILFIFDHYGIVQTPIKAFFYAVVIAFLIGLVIFIKNFSINFKLEKRVVNNIIKISYPMLLASSMALIVGWIDTFMVGYFIDERAVGIYNVAYKIGFFSAIFLTTINAVVSPRIAKLSSDGEYASLKKLIHDISKILCFGALVIFIISILNAKLFLSFFGAEFIEGSAALSFLLIGQLVSSYSGPVAIILQMTGNEKDFMYISIFIMVINVILNFVLIPNIGYLGAAIASSVSLIISNLLCVYFVKKRLGFYSIYIPFRTHAKN